MAGLDKPVFFVKFFTFLCVHICYNRNDGGVIMKVSISKSNNTTIYYLSKSVRIGSKTTTKTIEKIDTYDEIKEKCGDMEPLE